MAQNNTDTAEEQRLAEDAQHQANWKRWGPYLSERQWGTVREDYSPDGNCWTYFTHDQARSRAYRWGEDGILGITDRECRLCFAPAFWNGRDPILKERLFGLANEEGNHGEDVKELYYYLDATPTHSYLKGLYKYPQGEYPYDQLVAENRRRGRQNGEYELIDTGIFDQSRYFDVVVEYAKADPNDILIRITATNRGPDEAALHLLPTLWFRNTWSWGCRHEGCTLKPMIRQTSPSILATDHESLEKFQLIIGPGPDGRVPPVLFTENETNHRRLFGSPDPAPCVKDAFHEYIIRNNQNAVNNKAMGDKAAAYYTLNIPASGSVVVCLRLRTERENTGEALGPGFDRIFAQWIAEAEAFYRSRIPAELSPESRAIVRQGYAGLLWNKQFYHYIVEDWLKGDPNSSPPPPTRKKIRNFDWGHLYNRDVISVPDKWEYPWYAAWDLAFHMIPFAKIDPEFAKHQLMLFLREWYMHPNGQIPAYEFAFSDVNPPVHAWACWRVYKMTGPRGRRDRRFLAGVFQKLLLNFTWWVNRKDPGGDHIFSGGFLGLDNIGVFDRSRPLPGGGSLNQADGTAWMAFFCGTMLSMALELAREDEAYEDMASKFFEHFIHISDAINTLGGNGLWDEQDGFYYDQLRCGDKSMPLKVRSLVGLIPLIAVEIMDQNVLHGMKGFNKRMRWFLAYRKDLAEHISYMTCSHSDAPEPRYMLAIPARKRLERVLRYLLDENEFLSPFGVRSVSRYHQAHPYRFRADGEDLEVSYEPGESETGLFGGNSNWRGPIWIPLNYLIIEALQRYHHFYGPSFTVEFPTGSGRRITLGEVARELACRLTRIFLADENGRRPYLGKNNALAQAPGWRDLVLFHEYFHAESGLGLGASHQTGWTALIIRCFEELAKKQNS